MKRIGLPTSSAPAFSLVEVTLALGVAAFCLIALMGLLSAGINTNRAGIEQTSASLLIANVSTDLSSTAQPGPLFGFAANTAIQTRFVAEDGTISPTLVSSSRYRLTIQRNAGAGFASVPVRVFVSWPAAADPDPADWPSRFSGSQEITTALKPGP